MQELTMNMQEITGKVQRLIQSNERIKNLFKLRIFEGKTLDEMKKLRRKKGINPQSSGFKNMVSLYREYENNIEGLRRAYELAMMRWNSTKDLKYKKTLEEKKKEAEIIITRLYNPNVTAKDLALASGVVVNTIEELRADKIKLDEMKERDELVRINIEIMKVGKKIILEKMQEMNIKNMADLKSLSDLIDTAFKQNRLIQGESTQNVAIGIKELYDRIIENADIEKNPKIGP